MSEEDADDKLVVSICECCGQKIRKLNPHRMCKQKVDLLKMLHRAEGDWVFVQAGYGVEINGKMERAPYRANQHASRLVWFGLAEHGPVRSGKYRITPNGVKFLAGLHEVPATIYCKDGVVVETTEKKVGIRDVRGIILDKEYWDNYAHIQV